MRATAINHVSISAPDLEASVRFYTEVFGMERVATRQVRQREGGLAAPR